MLIQSASPQFWYGPPRHKYWHIWYPGELKMDSSFWLQHLICQIYIIKQV